MIIIIWSAGIPSMKAHFILPLNERLQIFPSVWQMALQMLQTPVQKKSTL